MNIVIDIHTRIYRQSQTARRPFLLCVRIVAFSFALLSISLPAVAQITLDVIGPHEYDLPVGFKPFNIFENVSAKIGHSRPRERDAVAV